MDSSVHFVAGKCFNHAFDLPPVAEMQHITRITAALGARRGLQSGFFAEPVHELRSFSQREAACDEWRVHASPLTQSSFPMPDKARQRRVDHVRSGLEPTPTVCHGQRMAKPSPMAGGFFWMTAILIGTTWGVAAGNPMKGVLLGTGFGGLIALAVWLVDRRRRRA
jgi:hypothetical protein